MEDDDVLQQYRHTWTSDGGRRCVKVLASAIDDGMPKAKPGDGIGRELNKISDIIARTAGSSSQSQPDPSQGTVVLTVDSCPRRRTPASPPGVRRLSLSPSRSPRLSPSSNPSEPQPLAQACSAHVVTSSSARGRAV